MFRDSSLIGDWAALAHRLEATGVVAGWAVADPALTSLSSLDQLHGWVVPGSDHDRADEVLGALVRLAVVDGGDDQDAVLVLLHVLSGGAYEAVHE